MKSWMLLVALLGAPSARAAELVVAGPAERVVAAGSLVAVVRGREVRVLEDGRPLLRLGGERALETARRREDVLEAAGIPEEERDSEAAEALLEDESSLRDRRRAGGAEEELAPLVAASESTVWIAQGHTLWRVGPERRAVPVALAERFDHLAATDARIVGARGARLFESRDEGRTFQRLADADGPVRALAAGGARVAWATGARLTLLDGAGSSTLPFTQALDLRLCDGAVLALGPRSLLVLSASGTRTVPARARRVTCAERTWVLVGPGLQVSTDEGLTFTEATELPPAELLDGAVGRDGLWLATPAGLFRLGGGAPGVALSGPPGWLVSRRDRAAWAPFVPRLVLVASAARAGGREELRAVAQADFPLGAAPVAPPARLLAQLEPAAAPPAPPLPPDREASCLPLTRASAVARAQVEPERARSYVARAGHAAWLPEVRGLYARRLGRSESLDLPTGSSAGDGPLGLDTANDVRWEARASWDLSKLVFSPDEIAAVTAALRMADMRREVESLANRLYFERRRLKVEPSSESRTRRELRIQELEAELDALSGGAFTRCLAAPP